MGPADLPGAGEIRVQGAVLAFACATTLLATLLFALAPALQEAHAEGAGPAVPAAPAASTP